MPDHPEQERVTVVLAERDAQTLRDLSGDYRTASAHPTLWDRLYEALGESLKDTSDAR